MPLDNPRVALAERTEQISAFARAARLRFRDEESALKAFAVLSSSGAVRLQSNERRPIQKYSILRSKKLK